MSSNNLRRIGLVVTVFAVLPLLAGCACKSFACEKTAKTTMLTSDKPVSDMPDAKPGECWAKCFTPPVMQTLTEQVVVKPVSERIEIVPAEYEWVEEKVCVKPASTQLIEQPARYETFEQTVVVAPARTDWIRQEAGHCAALAANTPGGAAACDVFCLVSQPPVEKTILTERMVSPATVREVVIPAEFQMVKTQRLVRPATCRRIEIPAEFATVEKTIKVADGRWEWKRVACDRTTSAETYGDLKLALRSAGYATSSSPNQLEEIDWVAIKQFQMDNHLAVGALTLETLDLLGVAVQQ
jgi:hypothetical protein